jgi:5-carboxymethyl-2-hydroxymuconate isomerase/acylpyruvate hydrolase
MQDMYVGVAEQKLDLKEHHAHAPHRRRSAKPGQDHLRHDRLNLKKQECREENSDCKKGHEIGIQGLSSAHGRYSTGISEPPKPFAMRLITFLNRRTKQIEIGCRIPNSTGGGVLCFEEAAARTGESQFPRTMKAFFRAGEPALATARRWVDMAQASSLLPVEEIEFLPPIMDADKFLCVGKNYRKHLEELTRTQLIKEIPEEPTGFIKLNSCLVGHEATITRPAGITRLDYEPELVFVIGKRALGVTKAEAFNYVVGVTVLNDLTCRDLQQREVASGSRFWTAKNIPGFGPLGPEIVTIDEIANPHDLWLTCQVNGEERMRVNTEEQIWKLPDILEHFSRFIPIEPGDMFSTGAPGGVAVGKDNSADLFLKPGDVVECSIEEVMTLRNRIVDPIGPSPVALDPATPKRG